MTFNKMRFPIVWITLALCVVLCAVEVHSGPVDHQDLRPASKDYTISRSARQEPYDEDSGEENDDGGDEEGDDDGGDGDQNDSEDEERSLKRNVRQASQRPILFEEQPDEDSDVIPSTDAPNTDQTTKKPSSVLLLLSSALDKAISATTKLPTQQMASDAASVFLLLGQVFSEAIDKVIGDDGPEESATEIIGLTDATEAPAAAEELIQLPIVAEAVKVEKQPQINSSQNDMNIASSFVAFN